MSAEPSTPRIKVSCINWSHPTAPHAAVWIKDAPIDQGGMSAYFPTHPEAVAYADRLAQHLARTNGATS